MQIRVQGVSELTEQHNVTSADIPPPPPLPPHTHTHAHTRTREEMLGIRIPSQAFVNRCLESVFRSKHPETDAWDPWSDPSICLQMLGFLGPIQASVNRCLVSLVSDHGFQVSVYGCLDRTTDPKHAYPDAWIGPRIPSICIRVLCSDYGFQASVSGSLAHPPPKPPSHPATRHQPPRFHHQTPSAHLPHTEKHTQAWNHAEALTRGTHSSNHARTHTRNQADACIQRANHTRTVGTLKPC